MRERSSLPVPHGSRLRYSTVENALMTSLARVFVMGKVFISYPRDDSIGLAGRVYDRLSAHFGRDAVFMDVDAIPFGVDFRQHLSEAVSQCDGVLLAIIGEDWLTISRAGNRRLDDPKDFVRIELEVALQRAIPVIPVLIEPATMPQEEELPETLRDLAYRNAATVDPGRDFHSHVDRLIRGVEHLLRVGPRDKGTSDLKDDEPSLESVREVPRPGSAGREVGGRVPFPAAEEPLTPGPLPGVPGRGGGSSDSHLESESD